MKRVSGKTLFPDVTETYVAVHDGGFDSNKGRGALVSDISVNKISGIRERIVSNQFSSRMAPIDGLPRDTSGRLITVKMGDKLVAQGISGNDAVRLQPGLWSSELTASHYSSAAYPQYLFQNLADMFVASEVPVGTHVKVFLSLGINIMHEQYGDIIHRNLMSPNVPFLVRRHDGREWFVSFGFVEIQPQPFWIMVDQIMRWDVRSDTLYPPDLSLLNQGGYFVVFDFGSNTFQSLSYANNMIGVHPICEGIGVWEVVKEQFKPRVIKKAIEAGIMIADPKVQQLMEAYKTGFYRAGKHEPLDLRAEKAEMNNLKVLQRLKTSQLTHKTGEDVQTMVCAGGDAEANFSQFEEAYNQGIRGEIRLATNEAGELNTVFSLADGGLKGAIRRWLKAMQTM